MRAVAGRDREREVDGRSWARSDARIMGPGPLIVRRSGTVAALAVVVCLTIAPAALATSWSLQPTPNPAGSQGTLLNAVSCSSASACTSVGYYYFNSAGDQTTLAERWNGTRWKLQPTPRARESQLNGVSCSSADACTAVGSFVTSAGQGEMLALRWNGTDWKLERPSTPPGETGGQLAGVSCSSPRACMAVGNSYTGAGNPVMLAERWNGTRWEVERTPSPAGTTVSGLSGVSCSAANGCTAIGDASNYPSPGVMLAERWNGTRWKLESIPSPAGATDPVLNGVSCWASSGCTAVGDYGNSSRNPATLAERWNGTRWKVERTPNRPGATFNELHGVSCSSASACTAVGDWINYPTYQGTLAERWNGTRWTLQRTPNPAGTTLSDLNDVSCLLPTACIGVGDFGGSSSHFDTLAESYS